MELYRAFIPSGKKTILHRGNPVFKLMGLVLVTIAVSLSNIYYLVFLTLLVIIEAKLADVTRRLIKAIKGIYIPILIIGSISFVLYGFWRTIEIIMRIFVMVFTVVVFLSTTTPVELSQSLEKLGLPASITMIPELSIKLIPFMIADSQNAINALILRGEIKPRRFIPKGITKMLAIIILSSLKRAELLAEALAAKFFGASHKRTILYDFTINIYDVLQLLIKILILVDLLFFGSLRYYFLFLLNIVYRILLFLLSYVL